jgi:dienelactone hydrolase
LIHAEANGLDAVASRLLGCAAWCAGPAIEIARSLHLPQRAASILQVKKVQKWLRQRMGITTFGVCGFGWGGALALELACAAPPLQSCSVHACCLGFISCRNSCVESCIGPTVDTRFEHNRRMPERQTATGAAGDTLFAASAACYATLFGREGEYAERAAAPVCLLATKGDPMEAVQAAMSKKACGPMCMFKRFGDQEPGWVVGARGDYRDDYHAARAGEAVKDLSHFFTNAMEESDSESD